MQSRQEKKIVFQSGELLGQFTDMQKSRSIWGKIREFELAGRGGRKRNRLKEQTGAKKDILSQIKDFWFGVLLSNEMFEDLRQKHVKIKFALERCKSVHHYYFFFSCSTSLPRLKKKICLLLDINYLYPYDNLKTR